MIKCMSDPRPVIKAPQMVPVFNYVIENLIQDTPDILKGKLPDGFPEILVKSKMTFEDLTNTDLCTNAGVEELREAIRPQLMSQWVSLKRTFERYCSLYRGWLMTDEGSVFVKGLNQTFDQALDAQAE